MQILASHGILGLASEAWFTSGRVMEAVALAARAGTAVAAGDGHAERADALQAQAQQMLLLDRTDEAAEAFERCIKEIPPQSRPDYHARASLVAGFQCQHRGQLRAAWNCFQRASDTRNAPPKLLVQAHAALASMYFGLGMRRPAAAAADRALALLDPDAPGSRVPQAMLQALKVEFLALDLLRQHERLGDLAFWPRHEEMAGARLGVQALRQQIETVRRGVAGLGFLEARLAYLEMLIETAYLGSSDDNRAMAHLRRLGELGLTMHLHAARHELALACIAGRQVERLRHLMLCYTGTARAPGGVEHNLEHAYCLAKLGELSGREDAYIQHYRDYASGALVHLRQTCAYITVPSTVRQAAAELPKDDIASRLVGKYRRAYQFILANLHRQELSVRDIADAIGVTERALQLAFRAALGMSPSSLIRQCRMDRVRDEIHRGAVGHGTTTLDIGRRWGLRSRSALSSAYKASFGELPSQTTSMALD
jgi:AraC-like DNA-binding protein